MEGELDVSVEVGGVGAASAQRQGAGWTVAGVQRLAASGQPGSELEPEPELEPDPEVQPQPQPAVSVSFVPFD